MNSRRQPVRRPFSDVRGLLLTRSQERRNPFDSMRHEDVCRILGELRTYDRDTWAAAFSACGEAYAERARRAEAAGDLDALREHLGYAYGCYRVARYPTTNSNGKRRAYERSCELYMRLAGLAVPPVERIEIPFRGGAGEGDRIVGYLHCPDGVPQPPLVIHWGGIDSFKEDRQVRAYLQHGLAVLVVDMPGTGEAPLKGSENAERMWDPILGWSAASGRFAPLRPAVVGASTGGYWATKLAHTRRDRIAAAVNRGGPAHFAFTEEWIRRAASGEYPFELAETLAHAFGLATEDEWIGYAPRLSLLAQGVLDRPSAPLLCVNGLDDSVFPIADHHLLLEHGDPKAARFFPGGHNAYGPQAKLVEPMIAAWVAARLAAPEARPRSPGAGVCSDRGTEG